MVPIADFGKPQKSSVGIAGEAAPPALHGPTFYRVANEIPTLIMVLVVLLVIVKPF